jgi:hypothetical protein
VGIGTCPKSGGRFAPRKEAEAFCEAWGRRLTQSDWNYITASLLQAKVSQVRFIEIAGPYMRAFSGKRPAWLLKKIATKPRLGEQARHSG